FHPVVVTATPETLFESEFYGHSRGAFTGADQEKLGHFGYANGGSLFLDEIAEATGEMQVKLLRPLEERCVYRLGDRRRLNFDIRVTSATHRDMKALMAEGKIREDFYYRMHVIPIHLPALRDRRDDIPILTDEFLRVHTARERGAGAPVCQADAAALAILCNHSWPGNVRELNHAIERAVAMGGNRIGASDFQEVLASEPGRPVGPGTLRQQRKSCDRKAVEAALQACGGRCNEAAALLDISVSALRALRARLNRIQERPPAGDLPAGL
ncbi:MAG: Fis family transcriptional, partial [Planctomycetota bacterium]